MDIYAFIDVKYATYLQVYRFCYWKKCWKLNTLQLDIYSSILFLGIMSSIGRLETVNDIYDIYAIVY